MGTIGFGAVSGGIGAELSGGNFWQGAVIGGIVAGLNHAMHEIDRSFADGGEDPPRKSKKLVNGKKLFREAVKHYREGSGNDLWVEAGSLDLSYVSQKDLIVNRDGSYSVNLINVDVNQEASLALGKISLNRIGKSNYFSIRNDKYDFNIEWGNIATKRNLLTAGAYILHHSNMGNYKLGTVYSWNFSAKSFWIKFKNSTYIKP